MNWLEIVALLANLVTLLVAVVGVLFYDNALRTAHAMIDAQLDCIGEWAAGVKNAGWRESDIDTITRVGWLEPSSTVFPVQGGPELVQIAMLDRITLRPRQLKSLVELNQAMASFNAVLNKVESFRANHAMALLRVHANLSAAIGPEHKADKGEGFTALVAASALSVEDRLLAHTLQAWLVMLHAGLIGVESGHGLHAAHSAARVAFSDSPFDQSQESTTLGTPLPPGPDRTAWGRRLEGLGALLIVIAPFYLVAVEQGRLGLALTLMGTGVVLWVLAFAVRRGGDEPPWARQVQVAILALALSQVGSIAISERNERANEVRARESDLQASVRDLRADTLAWRRALRADSLAWARQARLDSAEATRAQREALGRELERRGRVGGLDFELKTRLRVLRDSLNAMGALKPASARRDAIYQRAYAALQRFLRPRASLTNDIRSNTANGLMAALLNDFQRF